MLATETSRSVPGVEGSSACAAPASQRWLANLILGGLVAVVALGMVHVPKVSEPDLNWSWNSAYDYFQQHHLQAGVDYIFPWGPLTHAVVGCYDGAYYWQKWCFEIITRLVFAAVLFAVLRRFENLWLQIGCCIPLLVWGHLMLDMFYIVLMTFVALLTMLTEQPRPWLLIFVGLIATIASLVKASCLFFAIAAIALICCSLVARRLWGRALLLASLYSAWLAISWLMLGQKLVNLPRYLHGSLEVSSGYTEAMAIPGPRWEVFLALVILALLASTVLIHPRRLNWRQGQPFALGLLAVAVWVQWKQGFVRHDAHSMQFFGFCVLLPFLMPVALPGYDWKKVRRVLALAYTIPLACVGMAYASGEVCPPKEFATRIISHYGRNGRALLSLRELQRTLHADLDAQQAKWSLPKVTACVGNASVDLISCEQGILLLNHLNWHPRPVFQSYSAYTTDLLSRNAEFFRRPDAPEYLLFKVEPIDGRLVAEEEGQTLTEIFQWYEPVLTERTFLLLKHRSEARAVSSGQDSAHVERRIRMNEEIPLDDLHCKFESISFQIKPTWQGALRQVLYKPTTLHLNARTADGHQFTYRLIPAMAQSGFLINPLIQDNTDVVHLYAGSPGKRVVSISITGDHPKRRCYKDEITMVLDGLPELVDKHLKPDAVNHLLYPMLETAPVAVWSSAPVEQRLCEGKDVLLVHADGEMIFKPPQGSRKITGKFGILPEAYQQGQTDGVQFTIEYVPEHGGRQTLFQRYLDPLEKAQDRGMQTFSVPLPSESQGELHCRTSNLEGKNAAWDWSFWTSVKIR